ncbi:MAG: T9SS type A sorting domain-containing protein, partial [Bacteroidota bacterium]|nr:T9SS type A sorting domain-containing protein [Bacteroidota bacterium]
YDDDNEALWANNWDTDISMFDLSGNLMGSFPIGTWGSYYGFAYDNWTDGGPYLWGFSQDGSGAVLVQIDINTGTELFNLDVLPVLGGTEIAGGLYTMCSMVYNNKVTIGGLLQNEMLFGLELGPCGGPPIHWHVPDNLIGYKVYRDQDWIASIQYNGEDTSSYYDTGLDPYTFQYDVSALYNLAAYGFPGETGESMLEGPLLIQVQYGYPLPFEETWSSGNFELNEWDHSGNWLISGHSGNPHPSAEFSWFPVLTNYKSSLTTYPLDGVNLSNPWIDGCIWLDFDLKLVDRNMSGTEKLGIEVGNDNGWFKIREFDNARGSFGWENLHTDISNYAAGEIFRIRFVAEGENSSDILSWSVDNIYVYRDCPPPSDLDLEVQNCVDINLTWHSPYVCGSSSGNTGEWLHWDDGTNESGIGIAGGGTFSAASHWDPGMLNAYENMSISRIRFFAHESAINSGFTLKVWKGENAEILLYEQLMDNVQPGSWNMLILDSIVPLDITQELWFGYTVDAFAGESPAGHDAGPAIVGYGDMYSTDGIVWEPISGFGQQYDKNWNLQAYLSDSTGKMRPMMPSRELLGYNIYVELEYHDFTSDTSYVYTVSQNGTYRFEIFAVYEDCVSDSSIRGMIDIGCVGLDGMSSENILNIFPNPAKGSLYIQAQEDILELTLLDHLGHIIYQDRNTKAKMLKISTEDMVPGFYLLKVETKKSFYSKKVLIIP